MNKSKALKLSSSRGYVHYGLCSRTVGPRGGITYDVTEARVNGECQTWVRDPDRYRLPIKHGLRTYGAVTPDNEDLFHTADECPLDRKCQVPGCHQVMRHSGDLIIQHTHPNDSLTEGQQAVMRHHGYGYIVIVPGDEVDAKAQKAQRNMLPLDVFNRNK